MSATLDSTPLSRSKRFFVTRGMICASEFCPCRAVIEDERLDAIGLDGATEQLTRGQDVDGR